MRMKQLLANYRQNKLLYWLILPSLIFILIFNYIPMGGLIIAFQDYSFTRGIWGSEWIGFENFTDFFSGMYFGRTLGNTLALSGLDLLFNFPAAILLALMLNEVRSTRFKRYAAFHFYGRSCRVNQRVLRLLRSNFLLGRSIRWKTAELYLPTAVFP